MMVKLVFGHTSSSCPFAKNCKIDFIFIGATSTENNNIKFASGVDSQKTENVCIQVPNSRNTVQSLIKKYFSQT